MKNHRYGPNPCPKCGKVHINPRKGNKYPRKPKTGQPVEGTPQ